MNKRALALLLALALALSMLAGCGAGAAQSGDGADTSDSTESADTSSADTSDSADTGADAAEALTLTDEIRADPVAYLTDGSIHMDDTVMTVDGTPVSAGVFFYMLAYQYYQSSSMYANYGLTLDVTQSADETGATTIADYMLQQAREDAQRHILLQAHADELGLSLTEEQESELESLKAYLTEQVILFYASTMDDMLYANRASLLSTIINDYYYGENGVEAPTDDTLRDFAEDHGHFTCRYILLRTDDLDADDEAGRAAQLALAQDLYSRVKDLAGEEMLTTFAELQAEYNADGNTEPFSFDEDTSLVSGFREKLAELAHGEAGLTDETDYGYFVVLRLEPDLDEVREDYLSERYSAMVEQWLSQSTLETTPALDELDITACLGRLQALQDAVLSEMAAESAADESAENTADEAAEETADEAEDAAEETTEAE